MFKKVFLSVVGILVLSTAYVFAWTGATEDPPGGTYTPPLVVGPDVVVSDSSTNSSIWVNKTAAGNVMELQIGGVAKFIVMNSGRVGIGTNNPGGLLGFQDANTYIDVDGSNNLTFTDVNAGTLTLADLSSGGGGGGQITYDAVVDAGGSGDYTSVEDALSGGAKNIFVKRGSYTENQWNITTDGVQIVGEEMGTVIIEFTNTSNGLYVAANNLYFENIRFRGPSTDYLVNMDSGKDHIVFNKCIFEQGVHYLMYANNSSVKIYNCKFDGTDAADWGVIQDLYSDSLIVGSEIICNPNYSGIMSCMDGMGGLVAGNYITGERIVITTDYSGHFTGNRFRMRTANLGGSGAYSGNSFWNVGDPGTNAMITLEGGARLTDNYIKLSYYARKQLYARGTFNIIADNYFSGGQYIELDKEGIHFSGNTWDESSSMNRILSVTLMSNCQHCLVSDNIIRGKTQTPQIIDSGSNNTKVNNILYYR